MPRDALRMLDRQSVLLQYLGTDVQSLTKQPDDEVLNAYHRVAGRRGAFDRETERLPGTRGVGTVCGRRQGRPPWPDDPFE
jgi:hypothetical protein